MATDVLVSNTSYTYALYLNIVHFDRAIKAETRITTLENKCEILEKKVTDLIKIVESLRNHGVYKDPAVESDISEKSEPELSAM